MAAQGMAAQGMAAQGMAAQGMAAPGQATPGRAYPGQAYPGQAYPGQAYPGQAPPMGPGSSPPPAEQTSATSWTRSRDMSPAALANLVSAAAAAGRASVEETGYTAPPKPPKPARSGRVRVVVGTAIAVVLAGSLGVAAVALARSARDDQAGPPAVSPTTNTTPSPAAQQRSQAASPAPNPGVSKSNLYDPALAPRITAVEPLGGKTFNIRWSDPSKGRAQFAVVRVIVQEGDDKGEGIRNVANGVTEAKVTLAANDPGAPYCFLILAVFDFETRIPSQTQCVPAT